MLQPCVWSRSLAPASPPASEGATDAITMRASATLDFHLKFSLSDVPREREGYTLLAGTDAYGDRVLAPLFQDLASSDPSTQVLMLVPYQNARTFSQWLMDAGFEETLGVQVYRNFLETSRRLWRDTRSPERVQTRSLYGGRVDERKEKLAELLERDVSTLKIVVNGVRLGSFGSLIAGFKEKVRQLPQPTCCITHGDENSTNIMVFNDAIENGDPDGWVVVDYVNTRDTNDWVLSIAKMLQDWQVDHVLRLALESEQARTDLDASYAVEGDDLVLTFKRTPLSSTGRPPAFAWSSSHSQPQTRSRRK
jgi:hypothetical protein